MKELETIDEASLPTFLRRWYGEPDRKSPDIDSNIQMPDPLRNWYRLASQWSVSLSKYNQFSAPDELRFDGDKLIFWDENQGARSWATDSGGNDPLVYESEYDEDGNWKSTGALPAICGCLRGRTRKPGRPGQTRHGP